MQRSRIHRFVAVQMGMCAVLAAAGNDGWEQTRLLGTAAHEQGRFADAQRLLRTAMAQAAFDAADVRRADLDDELAGVCQVLGDPAEAERLYADALNVLAKHPDDGQAVRATVFGGLGLFRAHEGRLGEAQDLLEKAMASGRIGFGETDARMATVESSLGQVYVMQGKLADAEPMLQKAVAILKTTPASRLPERVVAETGLGSLRMAEGHYAEAEPILQQAVEEASPLGEAHPGYAGALTALADLYRLEGNSARGEPLLKKAQAIYASAFGAQSSRVAEVMLDRSIDNLTDKKSSLAETEILQALEMLRKANGADHPTTALAEFRLAQAYTMEGKYAEAEPLLQHALRVQESVYPEGHSLVADCMLQLAEVERLQQHYPDAEQQFRNAIAAYEKLGGSPNLAIALRQYAKLLRTSRTEEAKALERRAQGVQKGVQSFK